MTKLALSLARKENSDMKSVRAVFGVAGLFAAVCLSSCAAFADDAPDWRNFDFSTCVQLIESDDGSAAAGTRTDWSFYGSRFWSDSSNPHSGANYYVPAGMVHWMAGYNYSAAVQTFGGDRLLVAGTVHATSHSAVKCMDYHEAIFLPGSTYYEWIDCVTNKVLVVTTAEKPLTCVWYRPMGDNPAWVMHSQFPADVSSDSDESVILLTQEKNTQTARRSFTGDWSGYTGRIVDESLTVRNNFTNSFRGCRGTLAAGRGRTFDLLACGLSQNTVFAGTLAADEGGTLSVPAGAMTYGRPVVVNDGGTLALAAGATLSVPSLALADGATLVLPYAKGMDAPLTVTNAMTCGQARLVLSGFGVDAITNGVQTIPLVRLTGAAVARPPSVAGVVPPTAVGALPKGGSLQLADDGADKLVVYTWTRPVVANTSKGYDNLTDVSWVTDPTHYWSDGQDLHDGVDYLVIGASSTLLQNGHSIDFGDYPLTLAGGATVPYGYVKGSDVSYVCPDGVSSITWGCYGSTKKAFGPKTTVEGTWIVKGYGENSATFSGVLLGTGTLNLELYSNNDTKNPKFYGFLSADASDFGGRILINTPRVGAHEKGRPPMPDYDKDYVGRAYVSESKNLGGVFRADGDGSDAFTVKNSAELIVQGDVDYSEPTRGVLVVHQGNFKVSAGKTFKIRNRVTYAGEFVKRGPGALALGGTALFSTGSAPAEPSDPACTNKLTVKEGSLEILAGTATDGLEITFESGTALVLNGACAGGLRSVRPGSSVAIADDKLPVSFADGFVPEKADRKAVALATLASESEAAALAAKLQVPERLANVGKLAGELEVVANGDDTWTVQANYERLGLLVIIR